ncbi:MAG TPA: sigma-54-dependent Fis family transcriptional regulator [Nitrospirae bacterium]|nr:transcriptional regulatory protein ZraR [bacterium BMS3Abin06]HDH10655.1 sigma-54-dependent Fis family transcriptional regulator [Nitrospirota bacterium]HDZ01515.1 sigma-54-dependent Fis family transcriptional regulator [Nitrospirota bacterium]
MAQSKILVIDDEEFITRALRQHLEKEDREVLTAGTGEEGLEIFKTDVPDIVILDLNMPGISGIDTLKSIRKLSSDVVVIIITAHGDIETAVSAIKLGAYDFIEKPFELDRISVLIKKAMETVHLKREVNLFREEKFDTYSFNNIVGESAAMKDVITLAKKVAESDANTILIQGESGTGKSLLARAIHYYSPRASEPFVEVTCTAIPEALIESELFGYEKGAFTDAKASKKGLFEIAGEGTVYLDEIGDVKLSTQAKLLRALEEKTFKRVGGLKDIKVNVRIIATTNKKDLEGAVKDGSFRADLYYRLKVFPIFIIPLRERKEDIIPLAMHHIKMFNKEFRKNVKSISPEAEKLLLNYPWYGNARELRNIVERICILEDTDIINPVHLPSEIIEYVDTESGDNVSIDLPGEGLSLKDVEKDLIARALKRAGGNQTKAAGLLGISRDALRYKMQKSGLL